MSTLTQLRAVLRDHDADAILAALAEAGLQIKPVSAPRTTALAFHEQFQAAKRAACEELGERWYLRPGESQWITLPGRLANYRFTRRDGAESVTVRNPRDYRAPAPRFWPGARIPDGVAVGEG